MDNVNICPSCGKPIAPGAPQGLCPQCLIKSGFETKVEKEPAPGKSSFVPPAVEAMAKLFPNLEIVELLGKGGMGAVYKARQPRLNRFVALKILSPDKQNNPDFAERFQREARTLAWLNHPNIVAIYDFGEVPGMYYLLMEYVDGMSLRQLLQTRQLTPGQALALVTQICQALQFAHENGVIHRDIKPENILLDKKGQVKIADFGIAKIMDLGPEDLSLTGAADVMGTPHYMAPEQLEKPQTVDRRADIYSLGVVFYEMLTGELPIGKFQPPSQKVQIDVRLDEVVLHALEKEPDRRYQMARDVKTDVETIAGVAPAPKGPPPLPSGYSPRSKAPFILGVFGAMVLLLAVGAFVLFMLFHKTQPTEPAQALGPQPVKPAQPISAEKSPMDAGYWGPLNDDQRHVVQWTDDHFQQYFDQRTFEGMPDAQRADLERSMIDSLNGPKVSGDEKNDYFQAINTLAALHSTNALSALRERAFHREDRLIWTEAGNRGRWMSVRALGIIGDKESIPRLIHLTYHNNDVVRWWAQIALVKLTGENFGNDWQAWGKWWNSQSGQPRFDPQVIQWWPEQPAPDVWAKGMVAYDLKFLGKAPQPNPVASATPVAPPAAIYIGNKLGRVGGRAGRDPALVIMGEYSPDGPLALSPKSLPAGTIRDVKFYGRNYDFTLYALRPLGRANYLREQAFTVVAAAHFSGSAPKPGVQTLNVTGLRVAAGDLFAFAGIGPYYRWAADNGVYSDAAYENSNAPDSSTATPPGDPGAIFTVGFHKDQNAAYDYVHEAHGGPGRDYAIGVDVLPAEVRLHPQ